VLEEEEEDADDVFCSIPISKLVFSCKDDDCVRRNTLPPFLFLFLFLLFVLIFLLYVSE